MARRLYGRLLPYWPAALLQSASVSVPSVCCDTDCFLFLPEFAGEDGPLESPQLSPMTDQQGSQNQQGLLLTTPFRLASADDLQTPFTTYCQGYVGLLDFVWFERGRMSVSRTIPLPTQEEVRHTCLPSERFSSDHLAVSRSTMCRGADKVCRSIPFHTSVTCSTVWGHLLGLVPCSTPPRLGAPGVEMQSAHI